MPTNDTNIRVELYKRNDTYTTAEDGTKTYNGISYSVDVGCSFFSITMYSLLPLAVTKFWPVHCSGVFNHQQMILISELSYINVMILIQQLKMEQRHIME